MCQIFTVQKYRFGNIISTPREMCVHELYTIESSNMTWKMKTSTRIISCHLIDCGIDIQFPLCSQQLIDHHAINYINHINSINMKKLLYYVL